MMLPVDKLLAKIPKQFQCLRFAINDFDLSFKKGQLQLSLYHQKVDEPTDTATNCGRFRLMDLNITPKQIYDLVSGNVGGQYTQKIKEVVIAHRENVKKAEAKEKGKTEEL